MVKDKLFKKRPKVDWYSLYLELGDPNVFYYYDFMMQEPKWRKLSRQRRVYLALRHVYGDMPLRRYRYSGVWCV